MFKRLLLILLLIFQLVLVPGCWDYKDIDEQSVPIAGIYDLAKLSKKDQSDLKVASIFPVLYPRSEGKYRIEFITGETVGETREKRSYSDPELLDIGLIQACFFGEALAKQGLHGVTDALIRDPRTKNTLGMGLIEGDTDRISKVQIKSYPNPGLYLLDLLNTAKKASFLPIITLHQFGVQETAPGLNPVIPLLQIKDNAHIFISGTGIFRKDRLIAKADMVDTRSLVLLRGIGNSGNMDYFINKNGKEIDRGSLSVKSSRKVKVVRHGNDFTFFINIKLKGKLFEHSSKLFLIGTKNTISLKEIEKVIESHVERECSNFVTKMQNEYRVDCIDISKYALAKWRKELKETVDNEEFIKNAKIIIHVEVKIQNVGEIT